MSPLLADTLASPGAALTTGSAWSALREAARASLDAHGLPGRRTEGWRLTPLRGVLQLSVPPRVTVPETVELSALSPAVRAVIEDVVQADEADATICFVDGLRVSADGFNSSSSKLRVFDVVSHAPEGFGQIAQNKYFSALNACRAYGAIGAAVTGRDAKLGVVHILTTAGESQWSDPRLFIDVASKCELSLNETVLCLDPSAESGTPRVVQKALNSVVEVQLADEAALTHSRVADVRGHDEVFCLLGAMAVHQAERSRLCSQVVLRGGGLNRFDLEVTQQGNDAVSEVDSLSLGDARNHLEQHVVIVHEGMRGSSNQRYRGLADGRAVALHNGAVTVRANASGADAHQESRTVLLSDDAAAFAKPQLEIDTDEVACSHGATVGSLDEEALFYLRSRGIGEASALSILTASFAHEVLATPLPSGRSRWLRECVRHWFPAGSDMLEGCEGG